MKLLLDTHILLWALADSPRLSADHAKLLLDQDNQVLVSAISVAEIAIKTSLGKLETPPIGPEFLREQGYELLDFTAFHAAQLRELEWLYRDPFDRMIIAQALAEDLVLLTADANISRYPVRTAAPNS